LQGLIKDGGLSPTLTDTPANGLPKSELNKRSSDACGRDTTVDADSSASLPTHLSVSSSNLNVTDSHSIEPTASISRQNSLHKSQSEHKQCSSANTSESNSGLDASETATASEDKQHKDMDMQSTSISQSNLFSPSTRNLKPTSDTSSQRKTTIATPASAPLLSLSTQKCTSPRPQNVRRATSWFSFMPSYRSRSEEFRKLFGSQVSPDERLIVDFSCAYQREILAQGRMYISMHHICFYANILTWETRIVIPCKDIRQVNKMSTALLIPNAIQLVSRSGEKHFFTSFVAREKAYLMLFKVWQHALLSEPFVAKRLCHSCRKENSDGKSEAVEAQDESLTKSGETKECQRDELPISTPNVWGWIHEAYGEDLGFSIEEEANEKLASLLPMPMLTSSVSAKQCTICSCELSDEAVATFSCDSSTESDTFQDSGDFETPIRVTDAETEAVPAVESPLSNGKKFLCKIFLFQLFLYNLNLICLFFILEYLRNYSGFG
jgi:hypothetical protein